jgi:hypothetical protein
MARSLQAADEYEARAEAERLAAMREAAEAREAAERLRLAQNAEQAAIDEANRRALEEANRKLTEAEQLARDREVGRPACADTHWGCGLRVVGCGLWFVCGLWRRRETLIVPI